MKITEIRDLGIKELKDKAMELKEEIFRLKWQKSLNQLDNTAKIKNLKKDLARVLTVIKEKNFNK
ncbi:MAG: 50S ribosomal protein L29 [Proteobacteria bacterium]|nr:50S ribosomal protein L29 [Pseudomonadota bacterium]